MQELRKIGSTAPSWLNAPPGNGEYHSDAKRCEEICQPFTDGMAGNGLCSPEHERRLLAADCYSRCRVLYAHASARPKMA